MLIHWRRWEMLHNLKNKMKSLSTLFTYTWCYFLSMCITLWYISTEWHQDRDRDRDEDWDWDQWFVFCMCLTLTWNASDQIKCWFFCDFIFDCQKMNLLKPVELFKLTELGPFHHRSAWNWDSLNCLKWEKYMTFVIKCDQFLASLMLQNCS